MSTTGKHLRNETQILAEPDLPAIRITRDFDAPPQRVFRAYTDPDLVLQWLGPRRLTMRIDKYDAHSGGSYRYVHRDDDGTEYGFHGVFHEVRPNERIVQTFTYEGFPDAVSLETTLFDDLGGRTRVTVKSLMDSLEARDSMLRSGMDHGVREGHQRLAELLAHQQSDSTGPHGENGF
ncbi:SRPBCC family protein [Streptomyces ovatisporus]|uniref:SRPBCC family protein n=1 Tax=Streptomyces ovatisporus TaxID=1128682 RepID=A0ABV9A5J5_9ACTN